MEWHALAPKMSVRKSSRLPSMLKKMTCTWQDWRTERTLENIVIWFGINSIVWFSVRNDQHFAQASRLRGLSVTLCDQSQHSGHNVPAYLGPVTWEWSQEPVSGGRALGAPGRCPAWTASRAPPGGAFLSLPSPLPPSLDWCLPPEFSRICPSLAELRCSTFCPLEGARCFPSVAASAGPQDWPGKSAAWSSRGALSPAGLTQLAACGKVRAILTLTTNKRNENEETTLKYHFSPFRLAKFKA